MQFGVTALGTIMPSHPAVNGFVSLLSGISIEKCRVYAYILGFTNIVFF